MGNKLTQLCLENDNKELTNNPLLIATDTSFLARLLNVTHEAVADFFSDADNVRLKRAGGSQMKRLYAAKAELTTCIKHDGDEDNKIPAILHEFSYLTAFATRSLDKKLLELSATMLQHVAFGEQDEAEKLLTNHPKMIQKLLTTCGTFTDYSKREFRCTAYEYAYWAKDIHMCRMLGRYMDKDTKIVIREKIIAIDSVGLTYQPHGHPAEHSQHFDMTPLKEALQNYINWAATINSFSIRGAWQQVELMQRNLPAHVVNEYCRPDRSFHPLPTFTESTLPRMFSYQHPDYNVRFTFKKSKWPHDHWGLWRGEAAQAMCSILNGPGIANCQIDLAALNHLDAVRTTELAQLSRDILEITSPNHSGLGWA